MLTGTAQVDITPSRSLWMDGMLRLQRSQGVHDPLGARALVLANRASDLSDAGVIVSIDVCGLKTPMTDAARAAIAKRTGIPAAHIVLAATHTHSGPSTCFGYNPIETEYVEELHRQIVAVVIEAVGNLQPAAVGFGMGQETTISHYRRLMTTEGHVVMNWEPYPPEKIVGPLGVIDPEVGVLKVVDPAHPEIVRCLLFNQTGHLNVMSGENFFFSADYPGAAMRILRERFGGMATFLNGAQGSVDIDGLRDRDWEGVERLGKKLADVVAAVAATIRPSANTRVCCAQIAYAVPKRAITTKESVWMAKTLTGKDQLPGFLMPLDPHGLYGAQFNDLGSREAHGMPDGVGDDLLAYLWTEIRDHEAPMIRLEQTCLAVDDTAFLSFPGELFAEIGMQIKRESPFRHTCIIGNANGMVGYVPTRKAISEGSYEVRVRRVGDAAEELVLANSLDLLRRVHG